MGKREAELDGIEYYYDVNAGSRGSHGAWVYLVPCSYCGRKTKRVSYGRKAVYTCDECKREGIKERLTVEKTVRDFTETKEERRFNNAVARIQSQVRNFKDYERAIDIAKMAMDKYGSIPEAMVAIELIRLKYAIIPQKKVGPYRVDFYIPKQKMIIEVDGALYHKRGGDREAEIQLGMGFDTKILHIPAELIQDNIQRLAALIKKRNEIPY